MISLEINDIATITVMGIGYGCTHNISKSDTIYLLEIWRLMLGGI